METMQRMLACGLLAAGALGTQGVAQARDVYWSVGVGAPGVTVGVGNAPPVYYSPPPVYYSPPPVYYSPQPVYVAPPPVRVRPPAYYGPAPVYYYDDDRRHRRHRRHRGHYRHRHHDRDDD